METEDTNKKNNIEETEIEEEEGGMENREEEQKEDQELEEKEYKDKEGKLDDSNQPQMEEEESKEKSKEEVVVTTEPEQSNQNEDSKSVAESREKDNLIDEEEEESALPGEKEIHQYKCSMNKLKSAHLTEYIEVYECRTCKKDNICKDCWFECHSHDTENPEKKNKAQLLREVFDCYCHSKGHNIENMKDDREGQNNADQRFDPDLFFRKTKISARMDPNAKTHKIFEFIKENYYQHSLGNEEEKDKEIAFCMNIYDIASLNYVFFSEEKGSADFINENSCSSLFKESSPQIRSKEASYPLLTSFYKHMIDAHSQLNELFTDKTKQMEARVALEKISQEYDDHWKTFDILKQNFPIAPSLKNNRVMLKIYPIDFILNLFKSEIKKQDYLYTFKVQTLGTFIDIYIKPISQLKFKKILTNGFFNTTALHRYIFRDNVDKFFSEIDIPQQKYLELIDAVFTTLEKSLDEELVTPSDIFKQYYRLIKYMLSYTITDFNRIIVKLISQILRVREKCTKLKELLPELIKLIFVAVNDFVFHSYYQKRHSGPRDDIIEGSFIFEESPNNEATQLYLKMVKLLFSINFRTEEEIEFPIEIFDMLLVNRDDYIESFQSVLYCRKNYIAEKIQWIMDPNYVEDKPNKKEEKVEEDKEDDSIFQNADEKNYFLQENKDVNLVKQHEKLFESLSDCHKTLYEHLDLIKNHLEELEENHIQKSLNLCGSTNKNLKQLWMFKNGLFRYLAQINYFVFRSSQNLPAEAEKDYKDILQDICETIIRMLGKMVEDNSFLCSILFNEKALKIHFIPKFVETDEVGKFRNKLLSTLREDNYKLNFTPFIDTSKQNDTKTNKRYYNLDIIDPQIDLKDIKDMEEEETAYLSTMQKNNTTLVIYQEMLKLATKNSQDRVNHFVLEQVLANKKLITWVFQEFERILQERKLPCLDESFNKENAFDDDDTRLSNSQKIDIALNQFVLNFQKIINNLAPCYTFIIINDLFAIQTPLTNILKNINPDTGNSDVNFFKLKPEELIIFVKFYTKLNIRYPYELCDLNKANHPTDSNWSDNYIYHSEFELAVWDVKRAIYSPTHFEKKEDMIFEIIKNFPRYYNVYKNESFDKNPRFLLKFFLDVIVKPISQILYKIVYFSGPEFSNDTKYSIYVAVCLFFKSYKKILETIIGCGYIREEYYNLYKTFFVVTDTPDKDMDIFFLRIISDLERQIIKFDKDKVDFLNTKVLLDQFSKLLQKFQFKINNFKHFRDDKSNFNNLFKVVSSFTNTYLKLKKKPEINLVRNLIVNDLFEDVDSKDLIKRNLLLFPLYYYSLNEGEEVAHIDYDEKKCLKEANSQIYKNPRKSYYLKIINKVMKNDPAYYQQCLIKLNKEYDQKPLAWERIRFIPTAVSLTQFAFAEFSNMFPNVQNPFIKMYKRIVKFLSILCTKGNDFFIRFVSDFVVFRSIFISKRYSQHLLLCLSHIIKNLAHYDKVKDLMTSIITEKRKVKVSKDSFFSSIYKSLFHLKKQLVQSPERVLDKIQGYEFRLLQKQVEESVLENIKQHLEKDNKKIINFLLHFLDLLNLYVFDGKPKNYEEVNPNLILKLFVSMYEHIYKKYIPSTLKTDHDSLIYEAENLFKYMEKNMDIYHDETFKAYLKLIMYFIKLCQYEKKYNRLYDTMKKNVKESSNSKLSYNQRTLGEILKLFSKTLKSVEILVKHEEGDNKLDDEIYSKFSSLNNVTYEPGDTDQLAVPKLMYFEVHPDGAYIVPNDNDDFFKFSNYENSNNKMQYFLDYFDYIKTMISVRKEGQKNMQSHISNVMYKLDYEKVETYSIVFATITNLLIVFSMYYSDSTVVNPLGVYVVTSAILHLIFLFTCMSNLIWSEVSKYMQLKNLQKSAGVSFIDYASKYVSTSLWILIWNFLIGFIATLHPSLYFLYSLQMLSIFSKFETMQNVLVAIKLKYMQFLSTGILILILLLFYSIISVFFFQNQFLNSDLNENSCSTLLHCFLSFIVNGIRTGSGFGFPIKSYNESGYWSEFFFDWIFYFTIMLILINIINGVIVDTFQSLRTENEALIEEKENYCFICSLKRARYEAKGVDFNEHKQYEHNVMDYYQLFYKLDSMSESEMNYIEQYVYKKKNQSLTDFLPTKTHFRFTKAKK